MYSSLYTKKRFRINTTYLVIFFVVVGFFYAGYYFFNFFSPFTKAKKEAIVRKEVVNVAYNQFGIFWLSKKKESGWVIYGKNNDFLYKRALDIRDTSSYYGKYLLHYVMIKNLEPDTTYYYKIVSGGFTITDDTGDYFSFTTPSKSIYNDITSKPAYGRVLSPSGGGSGGTFVLLNYKNAYPLVVLSKPSGEWLIPLQRAVSYKTNKIISFHSSEQVVLEMFNDDKQYSKVRTRIDLISPLFENVVMGKSYTFLPSSSDVLPAWTSKKSEYSESEIAIQFPRSGSAIPGLRPIIKGVAVPGKEVKVVLKSDPEYTFKAKADARGLWSVRVISDLIPGTYMVVMETENEVGKIVIDRRYFIITKSGQSVLGEYTERATPEGELSPTKAVEKNPTPTEKPKPTATTFIEKEEPVYVEDPTPTTKIMVEVSPTKMTTATKLQTRKATITKEMIVKREDEPTPGVTYRYEPTSKIQGMISPTPPVAGEINASFILIALGFVIMGSSLVFII